MDALNQGMQPQYDDQELSSFYDPREMLERQYPALMDYPGSKEAENFKMKGTRCRQSNQMDENLQNHGNLVSPKSENAMTKNIKFRVSPKLLDK